MNAFTDETVFVPVTRSMRMRIEATIEQLVALLDEIDGDPDLEDERPDDEPWLGWAYVMGGIAMYGAVDDRERDDEHDEDCGDDEPGADDEPSLGALENHADQRAWGIGGYADGDDREHDKGDCCAAEDSLPLRSMITAPRGRAS